MLQAAVRRLVDYVSLDDGAGAAVGCKLYGSADAYTLKARGTGWYFATSASRAGPCG